jgi:predicted acyl esterase
VGPWAHVYPHDGVPGPAIGFLQEVLAWWDRWLKHDAAAPQEMFRAWMREDARDAGRWIAESSWPSPRVVSERWRFAPGQLVAPRDPPPPAASPPLVHLSPQTVGATAGSWCGFAFEATWPGEQSPDDARSLCFDSEPLGAAIEILGAPVVRLACEAGRLPALVAVRLVDVGPNGAAARVTYTLHALSASTSEIRLNDVAYRFEVGHRMRVAISTSYWPIAWPSPDLVPVRILAADCALVLPVRPPSDADAALAPFAPPEQAESDAAEAEPGVFVRAVTHDAATGFRVETIRIDADAHGAPLVTAVPGADVETGHGIVERFAIRDGEPLSARIEIEHRTVRRRPGWETRVAVRTSQWMTGDAFRLEGELMAYENGACVATRRWDETIPRHPAPPPDSGTGSGSLAEGSSSD